jgi:hypothetical protein
MLEISSDNPRQAFPSKSNVCGFGQEFTQEWSIKKGLNGDKHSSLLPTIEKKSFITLGLVKIFIL